ncbi:MAG: sensor histidine kinase [Roseivirga sp.]|nr:sensor histidine kinase [Roseivirga sp.]
MSRKLALKKLTKSDLTIFEWQFQNQPGKKSKQKAINLNSSVFIGQLYPGLPNSNALKNGRMEISTEIHGPRKGEVVHQASNRTITAASSTQKNWRLGGSLIPNPQDQPLRYSSLKPGDLVLFDFVGDEAPEKVRMLLISQSDQELWHSFNQLIPGERETMVRLKSDQVFNIISDSWLLKFLGEERSESKTIESGKYEPEQYELFSKQAGSENLKNRSDYHKIRPAGRHIITIGKDLIKDKYAAIVELVKNAYDADSKYCRVSLLPFSRGSEKGIKVVIRDEGHGMDYDTVVDKWMVPSTDDKLKRSTSPSGRKMQGKKGIGRYSASMIGDDLILQTVDKEGDLTALYLIWEHFESAKYLDDVDVLIENYATDKRPGTELIMIGDEAHLSEWNVKQIQNLKFELKKLIPPVASEHSIDADIENFKIQLELGDFPFDGFSNVVEDIEPYPLFDLFDYRVSGLVTNKGIAKLRFENNRIKGAPIQVIEDFDIILNKSDTRKGEEAYCGKLQLDFRVFDRDPASIDGLIQRGLKDPVTGAYVGKREARLILDNYNGIGVYRNGFRLRPLGDAGYDWLELDKQRVQNPSFRVGSDQIIGFIHIESEEESGLEEKSARDGLRETAEYFGLQEIGKQVLGKLEERRFSYRKNIGLGRSKRDLNVKINTLFDLKDVKNKINEELDTAGVEKTSKAIINKLISEKEESNAKIADDLKKAIALYQGQATLGKIVNVVLHEGRKPISYFKNQIPTISEWADEVREVYDQVTIDKIIDRLRVVYDQSDILIKLFNKLDPLSAKKRTHRKDFKVRTVIENVLDVFVSQLESQSIKCEIDCDTNQTFYGWKEDLYVVFTNLVDNSIYWLQGIQRAQKQILFKVYEDDNLLIIEYRDNGPGIDKTLIESEDIFEPEFSNKGGTGLGLAISGEAVDRNGGELKAIYSEDGAFFKVELKHQ